jgi:hypothetical protein
VGVVCCTCDASYNDVNEATLRPGLGNKAHTLVVRGEGWVGVGLGGGVSWMYVGAPRLKRASFSCALCAAAPCSACGCCGVLHAGACHEAFSVLGRQQSKEGGLLQVSVFTSERYSPMSGIRQAHSLSTEGLTVRSRKSPAGHTNVIHITPRLCNCHMKMLVEEWIQACRLAH